MAVEDEALEDEGSGGAPDGAGKSGSVGDAGGEDTGNRWKRRNDKLAESLKQERETRKELEARLSAIESDKSKATEALQLEQGKWQEVLEKREKRIAELEAATAERDARLSDYDNRERERTILEQLTSAEGLQAPPAKVRKMYLGLVVDKGLDRYPSEDKLGKEIEKRTKLMREEFPELFTAPKPTTTGGSPPSRSGRASEPKKPGASGGW